MTHRLNTPCIVYALSLVIVLIAAILLIQAVGGLVEGKKEPPGQIRNIYRSSQQIIHRHSSTPGWQSTVEEAQKTVEELDAEFPNLKDYSERTK
jgi:hypothetical protein